MERIPLPLELRAVPQGVLEVIFLLRLKVCSRKAMMSARTRVSLCRTAQDYVKGRIKQFTALYGRRLMGPTVPEHSLEAAYSAVAADLDLHQRQSQPEQESYILRFSHRCR